MKIKISKKLSISNNSKPLIVAEISANHCGNKKIFLKHIEKAADSGADLIKIQTYEAEDMTLNTKKKTHVIKDGLWKNKSLWDLYSSAQTPFSWHHEAFQIAKNKKKILFSSPFSERAVDFLENLNVSLYKIASFETNDFKLIKKIATTGKPIIISTGVSTIDEIKKALKLINKYHNKVIILHCISGYPTKESDMNLNRINLLKKTFKNNFIGLSDHTNDINTSLASIPLGVKLIEKHFKISSKIKSEDSKFSIVPSELRKLKNLSIVYHDALGNKKNIENKKTKSFFKRSLFYSKNLKKNHKLKSNDILSLRPYIGICSSNYFNIVRKKLIKNVKKNYPLKWKDF